MVVQREIQLHNSLRVLNMHSCRFHDSAMMGDDTGAQKGGGTRGTLQAQKVGVVDGPGAQVS